MKIEESFAVKRNEDDLRWDVYIEWLRGLENEKEDEFPLYLKSATKYVGITSISRKCMTNHDCHFDKIYTLDEVFVRFEDYGLVMPLSKANQLTREDYEKVLYDMNEYRKTHIIYTKKEFLDSIFGNPNKERIAEINKEMKRLRIERKSLEI